jgi:hypothetical protein
MVIDYLGKDIPANYFRGIEAVGGKIHFDEYGFSFFPHSINMQTDILRIDYGNIWGIKKEILSVLSRTGFRS